MFKIGDEVEVVNKEKSFYGYKGLVDDFDGDIISVVIVGKIGDYFVNVKESDLKLLPPKPFTKDDLRDGDIVTFRDGDNGIFWNKIFIYIVDDMTESLILDTYKDDLTKDSINSTYADIMQVTRNGEVVFKREESLNFYMKYHYCDIRQVIDGISKIDFKNKVVEITIKEVTSCNTN